MGVADRYNKKKKKQELTAQEKKAGGWFQSGLFEDGYDFGDITRTILGTATDVTENVFESGIGLLESAVDTAAYGVGMVGGLFSEDFQDDVGDFISKDLLHAKEVSEMITMGVTPYGLVNKLVNDDAENASVLGDKSDQLVQSGAQLAAQIGLQAVGVPWWVTAGISSFGSEVESALGQGATFGEAGISGAITTGAELLTEKISGGIKFGGKALDDAVTDKLAKGISNKVVKSLLKFGWDATGEGAEEVLSGAISAIGQKITYADDKELNELFSFEDAFDSFIGGAVLGGGNSAIASVKNSRGGRDPLTALTANEQKVLDSVVAERVAEAEKDGKKLTTKEKNEIYDRVQEELKKGYISTDTIEKVLGGDTYRSYQDTVSSEDAILKEFEELGNKTNSTLKEQARYAELQAKVKEIENNSNRSSLKTQLSEEVKKQLTRDVKGKTQTDNYLLESYNEKARRGQVFEADLSKYDKKQATVIQKAIDSGILNNTNRTHEFVDMIAKISADKGVIFDFANNEKIKNSGFAVDGNTVNGYVTKDGITLNIQSSKALNTVVGHEITHVLEGTELYSALQEAVTEYARAKGEYDGRYKALESLYKNVEGADINAELTADLVGDYLFTDQDFINSLSSNHRNIFQKIYDEIKYLCKIATAGSKEARELEKVKRAFDKAYKENVKAKENTAESGAKYSIVQLEDGRVYVEASRNVIHGDTIAEQRRDITNFFAELLGDNPSLDIHTIEGDVLTITKEETANKARDDYKTVDGKRVKLSDEEFAVKLNVEAHIDEVAEVSTKKGENQDTKDHSFAKDGFTYRRAYFKDFDGQYYEVTLSIGHNGSVATVYNVGKIKEGVSPSAKIIAVVGSQPLGKTPSSNSISQNSEKSTGNQKNSLSAENAAESGAKYSLSDNAETELHKALYDTKYRSEVRLREVSPSIMTSQKGVKNLPMVMNASHIRENVFTEEEAKSLGLRVDKHTHYHGLGEELFLQVVDGLDNVKEAYRGTSNATDPTRRENYFLLISEFKDKNGNTINVPVYINEHAQYNRVFIDVNKISTVFGRENFNDYINKQLKEKNLVRIKNRSTQISERNALIAMGYEKNASANSISQNSEKSTENQKNSLSAGNSDLGPIGNYNISGKDIEFFAPTKEDLDAMRQETASAVENLGPIGANTSEQSDIAPRSKNAADAKFSLSEADNIGPVKSEKEFPENFAPTAEDLAPATQDLGPRAEDEAKKSDGVQRKWVGTATDSQAVGGKILPDDLNQELIHYQPISNKKTLGEANARLGSMGYDASLKYFDSQFSNNKTTVEDIVLGERLIQEAIKRGDTQTAGKILEDVAILGTELGQKVQALSIIKRLTPEGQLRMLQRIVERGKTKGDKAFEGVEITQKMKDHILKTYGKDGTFDQAKLNKAVEDVKQQIADKMKVTKLEKVNAWRYLSMLGNPKTHIRNLFSNVAMRGTLVAKNAVARTIEGSTNTVAKLLGKDVPIKTRTKTWKRASEEVKTFSKNTAVEMKDIISGGGKYSEEASIKEKRAIFKNKILNGVYGFNNNLLSKEDWWFSKSVFKKSLSEYLTANAINTTADIANNPEVVEKAKQYAMEQSQIATFRQYSWLANKISEMERHNTATNIAIGAVLPFKKTPINIAKTALNYSPLGFTKTLTYDIVQVKNGKMEASTLVDHLSQNLTGTALTLVGYLLASAGLINGAGGDDKESKYDYQLGEQAYSINIGDSTFSLSWLSPVAMPLFVGANAYEQLVEGKEWNGDVVVEALAQTLDPLSEMSFLSSLDDVLSSYDSGFEKFAGIGHSMISNYTSQFIPTLSSQLASAVDDKKRTTKVAGDSGFKLFDETINNLKYKIPGLRNTLEPSTDIWGNEVKQNENIIGRAFESFLAPYSTRKNIASEVDAELKALYSETGDDGLIPSIPYNYVNYKNEKYEMSAEDYTAYKKAYGETAFELLQELFKTSTYRNATTEERAGMINDVYDYARDEAKRELLSKKNVEYTNSTLDGVPYYKENSINGAIANDMTADEYDLYRQSTEKYAVVKAIGGYKDYKRYSGELYKLKADKDRNGNAISGSRKKKVIEYINGLDADYGEKIILFRSEYKSDDTYNRDILEYLNSREDISYDEMVAILTELGFKIGSDGKTVRW